MRRPSERRRIDIAVEPRQGEVPAPPERPRPPGLLERALAWARRPRTRLAAGLLVAAAAAWAVAARLRPPTVQGSPLPRAGWRAICDTTPGAFARKAKGAPSGPAAALDGNPQTRWTTGALQADTQWFAVDMGQPQNFHQVVLDAGPSVHDYPRGYAVYLSGDGVRWGSALATGRGSGPLTIVDLGPQRARYLKIVQTGQDKAYWWSISELNVYGD